MSVVLLTTPPWVLESVKQRDAMARVIPGTSAILASREAILCNETLDAIHAQTVHFDVSKPTRTQHLIRGGYCLRITHDTRVIGPLRFVNVGSGGYTCPWGIWLLYKGGYDFENLEPMSVEESIDAFYRAQSFTHDYSERNRKHAQTMGYYADDKQLAEWKAAAMERLSSETQTTSVASLGAGAASAASVGAA